MQRPCGGRFLRLKEQVECLEHGEERRKWHEKTEEEAESDHYHLSKRLELLSTMRRSHEQF